MNEIIFAVEDAPEGGFSVRNKESRFLFRQKRLRSCARECVMLFIATLIPRRLPAHPAALRPW